MFVIMSLSKNSATTTCRPKCMQIIEMEAYFPTICGFDGVVFFAGSSPFYGQIQIPDPSISSVLKAQWLCFFLRGEQDQTNFSSETENQRTVTSQEIRHNNDTPNRSRHVPKRLLTVWQPEPRRDGFYVSSC
jgi:hypothetical protein